MQAHPVSQTSDKMPRMEIIVAFVVGILSGCALAYAWYRNRIDPQLGAARE